jgi:hypothetical protein
MGQFSNFRVLVGSLLLLAAEEVILETVLLSYPRKSEPLGTVSLCQAAGNIKPMIVRIIVDDLIESYHIRGSWISHLRLYSPKLFKGSTIRTHDVVAETFPPINSRGYYWW